MLPALPLIRKVPENTARHTPTGSCFICLERTEIREINLDSLPKFTNPEPD